MKNLEPLKIYCYFGDSWYYPHLKFKTYTRQYMVTLHIMEAMCFYQGSHEVNYDFFSKLNERT
jgi:hypothetical protein